MRRCGAWNNSGVRREVPDPLREYLDHADRPLLKSCLSLLNELTQEYGFRPAATAMDLALRDGRISKSDAKIIAARITGYGIDTPPAEGPSLDVYDDTFLGTAKGGVSS